jgi:pyruvate kinase
MNMITPSARTIRDDIGIETAISAIPVDDQRETLSKCSRNGRYVKPAGAA